jgi:hypothetical protein
MERFNRLSGSLLVFVYLCFDRVVINGYLFGLPRSGETNGRAARGRRINELAGTARPT